MGYRKNIYSLSCLSVLLCAIELEGLLGVPPCCGPSIFSFFIASVLAAQRDGLRTLSFPAC